MTGDLETLRGRAIDLGFAMGEKGFSAEDNPYTGVCSFLARLWDASFKTTVLVAKAGQRDDERG